jgi:hypothetical protein
MKAPAGTILDIVQLEYISQGGEIQIPRENRNGMRYIAKEGVNEMISLKRRSGRYIYLTLRQMSGPVEIQNFHLIESTYPSITRAASPAAMRACPKSGISPRAP